ncbi:sushi, von Willebrand factor type A, EGF and pentraxin domain-containing protein 1 [Cimex lectularius]|uniref:Sushi, von Willebrand factor type A, EGF and pentraxin domain-containing protein 1 n=1 Tax=Cimex lectularius TaxID=79782 RepID=A0A8I6TFU9_CIMLE|nr:sushi, von Willebrand factor type A, EGF and pentraxin domain-containing protein 1 [Cimex lectularius]
MKFFLPLLAGILSSAFADTKCGYPGAPAHSTVEFSKKDLSVSTIATYRCEAGFELLGPPRRICTAQGTWKPEGIPFCVINVAAGKAPMQISSEDTGVPQKAIDGSTTSFFNADTCTLTRPERVPWWYVNLLEPYMVQLVRLDFGKPCCGKNKPATIVVRVGNNRPDLATNPICNRFTGYLEEGKPLFLPCNPPMPGAFVSVHLESSSNTNQLSICEAFVYTDQALPIERCPQFRDQPPGSTATYNGKCYIFYNRQPLPLRDALNFCRSRGGSLVEESNPALQGFISWELWRRHRSDSSSQYWMGAVRDHKDRNNWKWINGEDVTVSFWNLPGGEEDCARYDGSKGWLWSDTNCHAKINYICQHQPKACGKPEQPPNSTMTAENFNVGAKIEYTCDEGHLLVGPNSRICLPTGFYNEFPPVCKRIQCGYPADITNGDYQLLNGTVGYLSQVLYSCNEGYKMTGRAQLTCDLDERWDGPPPRCQPILCGEPPIVANGDMFLSNNITIAGTVVEYSCISKKYKLVGPKQITCLDSGNYDKPPPVCREEPRGGILSSLLPNRPSTTSRSPPREKPRPFTTRPSPKPITPDVVLDDNKLSETKHIPHIVLAGRPQNSDITETTKNDLGRNGADIPGHTAQEERTTLGAKLNLGAIIALGIFGGFVFLAAVVTTVVILIKRNRSAKHYRHRGSPDSNTVASFDSSGSESRGGLNRYYRQAWENLQQSAVKPSATTANGKETPTERDGSELVVSDVYRPQDKKRHHHHQHHHHHHGHQHTHGQHDWRQHKNHRY